MKPMGESSSGSGEHRLSTPPPPYPSERPPELIGEYSIPFILSHAKHRAATVRGLLSNPNRTSLENELVVLEKIIAACETWKESR
jgi:hypothetical protein